MNNSTTHTVLQGVVIGLTISAVVGFAGWWYYQNYLLPKINSASSNPLATAANILL